ncbi:glycosyltransferase family 4 protein [bacterium]|nr:glycosyltransferase family 4 protein [bacterium]
MYHYPKYVTFLPVITLNRPLVALLKLPLMSETNKIRVLHIIGSGNIGGAEKFVYQLASHQKRFDPEIEPAILFCKAEGYFRELAEQEQLNNFVYHEPAGLRLAWSAVRYFKQFDVLHFHGLYPKLFFFALLSRRRIFYFVHGARALTSSPSQIVNRFARIPSSKSLPTFRGLKRFLTRQWLNVFLKYVVTQVHAPSRHYVNFCIKHYGVPEHKISQLALGINFCDLAITREPAQIREELGLKKNERVVGCISTFRKLKRIDRLISGFAMLLEKSKMGNVRLLIVGDGDERPIVERQIEEFKLRHLVILTGLRKDIANLLSIMDIFVMPSESESFSISSIEAMYFKLPVIGFQLSGGMEEILNDSGAGITVKDEFELANVMGMLLNNRSKSLCFGEKGHRYVVEKLSFRVFADEIRNCYEQALPQSSFVRSF